MLAVVRMVGTSVTSVSRWLKEKGECAGTYARKRAGDDNLIDHINVKCRHMWR